MIDSNFSEKKIKGVASLFNEIELKAFFKRYLIFIGLLEVFIFIIAWFSQLGIEDYDRFGPIDIPFPWKTYFLIAFLAPVSITFIIGIFIVAFNKYVYHHEIPNYKNTALKDESNRIVNFVNIIFNLPFLFSLLLLGLGAGIIYRIDDVVLLLGNVGEKSIRFLIIILSMALVSGLIIGIIWMILKYKLRKQSMEYQYKTEVMERIGIVMLDNNTFINKEGKLILLNKDIPLIEMDKNIKE